MFQKYFLTLMIYRKIKILLKLLLAKMAQLIKTDKATT